MLRDRIKSLERALDRLDVEMRTAIATYEIYRRSAFDRDVIAGFDNTLEANTFNVVRDHIHHSTLLALTRMWDEHESTRAAIPQLMGRIDEPMVEFFVNRRQEAMLDISKRHQFINADITDDAAREAIRESIARMTQRDADKAAKAVRRQLGICRRLVNDKRFRQMRAILFRYRNRVLAHIGSYPGQQAHPEAVRPLRIGDTEIVLERTIKIIEFLNTIARGLNMNYASTQEVWERYAREFWSRVKGRDQGTLRSLEAHRIAVSGEG